MTRIGVRELGQHASRYLALVKRGETVQVTERGELVALLVPPHPSQTARDQLVADGRLVPTSERTGRFPTPTTAAHTRTNRELLDAEREDRL